MQKHGNITELVEHTLSVFPLMTKKLFGTVPLFADSDLHQTHFHILHTIAEADFIRTTEIARKLGIQKSNLTPLMHKLMDKNFIQRERAESDRRVITIRLTEEGEAFLQEKKAILEKEVKKRLQQLSASDQEKLLHAVNDLNEVLGKLDH